MLCAACWEPTPCDPCAHCASPALLDLRFRLDRRLGDGRAAVTWQAIRAHDGTVVAIKELPFRRAHTAKERELVAREADVLRQLDHPGIPAFHEAFLAGRGRSRALYIVEEYVDGHTLADEMRDRRYDEAQVLDILEEVLQILMYLHGLSPPVIHRDIKPHNVMRHSDGHLVLIDFGSVRDVVRDPDLGGSTVAGTFGYMAPEQFRGDAVPATDLYGLGALAVALLTRQEPHTLLDWAQRLQWRNHTRVSDGMADLLSAVLRPDAHRRPQHAGHLLKWVRALKRAPIAPRLRPAKPVPFAAAPPAPSGAPTMVRELVEAVDELRETRLQRLSEAQRNRPVGRRRNQPPLMLAEFARHFALGSVFLAVAFCMVLGAAATLNLQLLAGRALATEASLPTRWVSPGPAEFDAPTLRRTMVLDKGVRLCFAEHRLPLGDRATVEVVLVPPGDVVVRPDWDVTPLELCIVEAARYLDFPEFRTDKHRYQYVELN